MKIYPLAVAVILFAALRAQGATMYSLIELHAGCTLHFSVESNETPTWPIRVEVLGPDGAVKDSLSLDIARGHSEGQLDVSGGLDPLDFSYQLGVIRTTMPLGLHIQWSRRQECIQGDRLSSLEGPFTWDWPHEVGEPTVATLTPSQFIVAFNISDSEIVVRYCAPTDPQLGCGSSEAVRLRPYSNIALRGQNTRYILVVASGPSVLFRVTPSDGSLQHFTSHSSIQFEGVAK